MSFHVTHVTHVTQVIQVTHVTHVTHVTQVIQVTHVIPCDPCDPCHSFTNAVLTDVTESLFSAVKRWIYGRGTASPSLLLAIVRIANGVWGMIMKPTLKDISTTMKKTVSTFGNNQPAG